MGLKTLDSEQLVELLTRDQEEPGDLQATLDRIGRAAEAVFGTDLCVLFAANPVTGRFLEQPAVLGELRGKQVNSLTAPRDDGMSRRILREGLVVVEDLVARPEYATPFSRSQELRAFAAVALCTTRRHRPLAVAYLDFRAPRTFGEEDRELLARFSRHASALLQNTWFLRRYQAVAQAGRAINEELDTVEHLFRRLRGHLGGVIDTSYCFLLGVHQAPTNTLDFYVNVSGRDHTLEERPLEVAWEAVLEQRRTLLEPDLGDDDRMGFWQLLQSLPEAPERPPRTLLCVPLTFQDRPLGFLAVLHPTAGAYDGEDRHLLELLANHVAAAMSNLRQLYNLRRLSEAGRELTDHLESEGLLEMVADLVRSTAGADVALLYPYLEVSGIFEPPTRSGELRQPDFEQPRYVRPDDMAYLVVRHGQAQFAEDSATLYALLGGDPAARRGSFERREGVRSTAALPLRVGEETVGVLFVNFRIPQSFDESRQQLMNGLASFAAIAIKNARELGAQSHLHIEELKSLQEIDRALNSSVDRQDLLETILRLAAKMGSSRDAAILLYDPKRQVLDPVVQFGEGEKLAVSLADGRGLTAVAFHERRPILVPDVYAPEWRDRFIDIGSGTLSELDVPLRDGEDVVGILNLENQAPGAFTERHQHFLVTLAAQAVLALKKVQAYEHERRLASERQALIDLGKELTRRVDVRDLLDLIVERALEITGATAGVLVLKEEGRDELVVAAERGSARGLLQRRLGPEEGLIGWVAREGQLVNVPDVTQPPWYAVCLHVIPETRAELAAPIFEDTRLRGVLNVESPEMGRFQERDERLLSALADLAAVALQNAERYQNAEKRRRRLKALHQVVKEVVEKLEKPDLVMRAVVEHALGLTEATIADLDLYEEGELKATYQVRSGASPVLIDLTVPGVECPPRGIMAHVARTLAPHRTGNVQADAYYLPDASPLPGAEIQSELAVPLIRGEQGLFGVLNVESPNPYAFDGDDQEVLEMFAAQVVVGIENSRNFERSMRRSRRFELLHEAGMSLGGISDLAQLDEAYDIVLRIARESCDSQVVIRRFDPATRELVRVRMAVEEAPLPFERIPLEDNLNGWVARKRQHLVVADVFSRQQEMEEFERSNPADRAFVVVPILFRNNYYGNLALSHPRPNHFAEADVKLILGLAQQLGITIHRLEEVSARQQADQRAREAQAMSWIGKQTYEIAHRMGNDLGLVPRNVRKIRKLLSPVPVVDPGVERSLESILSDARKVIQLSKDLSHLLRSQSSEQRASFPVQEVVREALGDLPERWRKHRFEVQVPDDLKLRAVYNQISSALYNLVMNALEATPGGGTITVGAENLGREVKLWVGDTGPGIKAADRSSVFDLFHSTKKGSSGYGLWSVRSNVLENGGRIVLQPSEPGQGATFVIYLPRPEDEEGGRA